MQGDRATAVSKGGYVMASADNSKADFLLLATYRDVLIKEDGKWKFLRREIAGDIPVPRVAGRDAAGEGRARDLVCHAPPACWWWRLPMPATILTFARRQPGPPELVAGPRRRLMGCRKRRSPRLRPPCRRRGRSLIAGRCWPT